ncbi:MAG TPA: non-homologous end-joining DNA ligase [Conexibacter sp.]|jgi:bifunctional non-homologous end joining protein LigD
MPEHVKPMNATLRAAPPADADERWQWEVKWDGMRAVIHVVDRTLRIETRTLHDVTIDYPELSPLADALGDHDALLDGEIVVLDDNGRPSFQMLQARFGLGDKRRIERLAASAPVTVMLFDLLWLDGASLIGQPLTERRAALVGLGLDAERWRTPAAFRESGPLLRESKQLGLEGVMGKRLDSRYEVGKRSTAWIKVKNHIRQEVVVAGWLPGEGRRLDTLGALVIGVHDQRGELTYIGRVGTGFNDQELRRLVGLLLPRRRDTSPFTGRQPPRETVFVEPDLVAEIAASEWTTAGTLRHPSYKGLREDKPASEVVREVPTSG